MKTDRLKLTRPRFRMCHGKGFMSHGRVESLRSGFFWKVGELLFFHCFSEAAASADPPLPSAECMCIRSSPFCQVTVSWSHA